MLLRSLLLLLVVLFVSSTLGAAPTTKLNNSPKDTSEEPVEEFCTATPAANLPPVAQCRPATDTSVEYQIEVTAISGRGLSNQCDIQLSIIGTGGESQPVTISSADAGTRRKQVVSLDDIGSPTQVQVSFIGSSANKWKCQKIVVRQAFRWWAFDCIGTLDSTHNEAIYPLSGNKLYTITVQTGSDDLAGTHGAIELNIKGGLSRETGSKLLAQGFASASQKVITYRGADVGLLQEIVITNTADDDPWYCIFIDIRGDDGKVAHFTVRRWIGTPYDKSVKILLNAQHLIDTPAQDIECFTRGSDIVSGLPNQLEVTKVRCPMNCDNNPFALVRGSSVHPSTSSICQSAVLDGVLGPSGGELVVTAIGALPAYFEPPEALTHVQARDYEPSPDKPTFSYFLYQSDSIDNINKEVRVVDAYGKLSAVGRLELRREGVWGAVCSKGDLGGFNQAAARQACQEIGFIHGIYLDDGCNNVKGTNVCSGKGYRTVVAAVQCTGTEKTILECTYEEPPAICSDHVFDVAVQCTNFPPNREPPAGAIRIVDSNDAPAVSGIGRLEYYLNGWGTVCDDGFSFESEGVACHEMGYSSVKAGGISRKGCKDAQGANLCATPQKKINVVNLACDGTEKNIRNCPHETHSDIYCVHDEDIVISCEGDGDPSGIGLYQKEEFPEVGTRPYAPIVNLNCGDRPINTKSLKGSPGAMFIVRCPEGCSEDPTDVRGTFIYTDDSSVCRAALHIGAVDDSGGDFVLVLGYGQKSYAGTTRGHVQSSPMGPYARSFMVSLLIPSVRANVAPESKKSIYLHFAGESLLTKAGSVSFLQNPAPDDGGESGTSYNLEPVFSWCPPPGFSGFHQRPSDFVDASKLPGGAILTTSSDFSISARFRVTGRSGTWRTVLAHTGCNGFTLAVNKNDELLFEQVCNSKSVMTGFKPQLAEWVHVLVTYFQPDQTVSIFVNGRRMVYEKTNYVFNFQSPLTIGRSSYIDTEFFEGDIGCIRIFSFVFNPAQIQQEKELTEKPSYACPLGTNLSGASRTRYTVDGRLCLTPCVPRPSNGQEAHETHLQEYGTPTKTRATHPAFPITCNTTLEDDRFDGATGDCFRVICPSGCCSSTAPVYGTEFYAAKSSICRAALHKGVMGNSGAEISITLQNGLSFYGGSMGHNYIESQLENTPQCRSFTLARAHRVTPLTCHSDASFIMKMPLAARHLVHCPSQCRDELKARVYGSHAYTPASAVCRAALHAGVLTNSGGQVEIEVTGDGHFDGSVSNGVESFASDYYLRSFSFPHTGQVACIPFSLQEAVSDTKVFKTRRSLWQQYPTPSLAAETFQIVPYNEVFSQPEGAEMQPNAVAIVIRDVHVEESTQPSLFVLNRFNCDQYRIYATFVFTNTSSAAGVCFGVKEDRQNFFALTATATEKNDLGTWAFTKFFNGQGVSVGKPIPFRLSLNTPLHVHVVNDGDEIQGWTLTPDGKKHMVAHVKDVHAGTDEAGSVGVHVFDAPSSGVRFTHFQVYVSPENTDDPQRPPAWNAFQQAEEVSPSTDFRVMAVSQRVG